MNNLNDLKDKQKQLDEHIWKKFNLTREKTQNDRLTALLVEFFEFVNATGYFKYWKVKEPVREDIIEEYIDMLHFSLSLSVDFNYVLGFPYGIEKENYKLDDVLEKFIDAIPKLVAKVKEQDTHLNKELFFIVLMEYVRTLILFLDLEEFELIEEYEKKYEINLKRQEEGY